MASSFITKAKHILGIDKAEKFRDIIKHNGGLWPSVKKLYFTDELKIGKLVGVDDFGNKYYENPEYFVPRNRWVEFNEKVGLNYDASMIPAEWHKWITHMTEYPPSVEKPPQYPWLSPHEQNQTGTSKAYVPYSTVKPKIQAWTPPGGNPRLALKDST